MKCGKSEGLVLDGAQEVRKGDRTGSGWWGAGRLPWEFFVSAPLLFREALHHLSCALLQYGNTEATSADFEGQKWEGSMGQFPWHLTILFAGKARPSNRGFSPENPESGLGIAAQGLVPAAARFSLSDVWAEGEEQWGLERSLYSGRKAAFSVHVLLEEHPGWYVFHNTVQLDPSWAVWIHDLPCMF